jgi:4-amino-4-deoxy-L-arabinose transferase-like glycosyltransferase
LHRLHARLSSITLLLVPIAATVAQLHGQAPGYPFLVAAVFWLFGIDSQASAVVLLLLNTVVSSLTAVVIYKLGRECLTEEVGLIAAWAWALSPLGVLMPLLLLDISLSALMLALGLLVLLRANSPRQWAWAGALWGASALVNTSLLAPCLQYLFQGCGNYRNG